VTIPKSIWIRDYELLDVHANGFTDAFVSDHERECGDQLEYVLKSNPPLDHEPSRRCGFSGGRENTPFAEIVPCNYYRAEPGEVSLEITGRCSCGTLEMIVNWFKRQTIEKTNAGGERYRIFASEK
jgi:hypothetical protein